MQVFNLCWKMIRHRWRPFMVYIVVFLGFVILVDQNLYKDSNESNIKVKALLLNEDKENALTRQMIRFMSEYIDFVDAEAESESQIENALFYEDYKCVIRIPEGFTEDFLAGRELKIVRHHFTETSDTVLVELLISQYLDVLRLYEGQDMTLEESVLLSDRVLSQKTGISYENAENKNNERFGIYANYLSYPLVSVVMFYTVLILYYLRREQISMRNTMAPVQMESLYKEVFAAVLLFAWLVAVLLAAVGIIMIQPDVEEPGIILICINIVMYTGYCVSLGFILGMLAKSLRRLDWLEQIIAIGISFMGGVFVKQEVLSSRIVAISSLFPTYWFVKNNNELCGKVSIGFHEYQQFSIQEGIILCSSGILFVIALIIGERKVKMDLKA